MCPHFTDEWPYCADRLFVFIFSGSVYLIHINLVLIFCDPFYIRDFLYVYDMVKKQITTLGTFTFAIM